MLKVFKWFVRLFKKARIVNFNDDIVLSLLWQLELAVCINNEQYFNEIMVELEVFFEEAEQKMPDHTKSLVNELRELLGKVEFQVYNKGGTT